VGQDARSETRAYSVESLAVGAVHDRGLGQAGSLLTGSGGRRRVTGADPADLWQVHSRSDPAE
jgi:hypothetical protein